MVFSSLHPLAESDPDERTPAREQTPAAEAAAWLENPERQDQPSPNMRWIEMLAQAPQWTGPLPSEQPAFPPMLRMDGAPESCGAIICMDS